jgi:parvulin-like peptidyl-prolyl isomerase
MNGGKANLGGQTLMAASMIAAFSLGVSAQAAVKKPVAAKPAAAKTAMPAARASNDSLTSLTPDDVRTLVLDQTKNSPDALAQLSASADRRKAVLENLREALAVASEARKTGFAADESIKMQIELAHKEAFANLYNDKLRADAKKTDSGTPLDQIDDKAADAFFSAPATKTKYAAEQEKFLNFVKTEQAKLGAGDMSDDQKKYIIAQWRKVTFGSARAETLRLNDKKAMLRWKFQQALLLTAAYSSQKLADDLVPTDAEVSAYMAAEPRFSRAPMRARAEEVLTKVKAGGDFAALANQYSEDPGNKDPQTGAPQGGFYDWHSRNGYVKEFSDAAWALEVGQVSPIVETEFGFHIIKLEGKRTVKDEKGADDEQVKVRHILISTEYKDPAAAADQQFVTMEDGARKELTLKKTQALIDDIKKRNPITLPADFSVEEKPAVPSAKSPATVKAAPKVGKKKA